MTNSGKAVLGGFAKLYFTDKKEVIDELKKFENSSQAEQYSLNESYEKIGRVVMGPTSSGGCPLCGK